jgi:hypothetical protein
LFAINLRIRRSILQARTALYNGSKSSLLAGIPAKGRARKLLVEAEEAQQRPFSTAISAGGYGNSERQSRLGEIAGEGQDEGQYTMFFEDITPHPDRKRSGLSHVEKLPPGIRRNRQCFLSSNWTCRRKKPQEEFEILARSQVLGARR